MIGTIGKLLILVAFVAGGLSGLTFLRSSQLDNHAGEWKRIGRYAWWVMGIASVSAFGLLIFLNVTHQFQYAYTWQYTSLNLPLKFLVSSSWAGQEGSFLLWIVLNSIVGIAVIRFAREYESPVMAVISLCQVFLITMVVGLQIGPIAVGSSPFATLVEQFPTAPMIQAGILPTDGDGLNDLLQNYWMVIHPPILFSGFAAMMVPFAFAVTALWKKRYTEWVRPALPWTVLAVLLLGVGISLGGYWAYVTLSFGGYWAWDPVENSSLVPWLIGVAALHTMIVQKRSGHSHKASIFLAVFAYMLVIYSTFLTRSGILGDVSVHSFVDLGLYNQLLVWILTIGLLGFGLFFARMKELPRPDHEPEVLSREFMIFVGAMLVCGIALVILMGTSAPIVGNVFRDNPSTVPIEFYNKWALPLTILFLFLAGLGQLFWWNKMTVEKINSVLIRPIVLAAVSTILVLVLTPFSERTIMPAPSVAAVSDNVTQAAIFGGLADFWAQYGFGVLMLLLTFVAFFALYGNGTVLWRIARGNFRLAGGALSHVGFALLILGIVASSGFNRPLGKSRGVQMGDSRDNFVLYQGATRNVDGYTVTYRGKETNDEGHPTYQLDFTTPNGSSFTSQPVVYQSNKGQWIQNPDIHKFPVKDLFVAVAPNIMFDTDETGGTISIARGDSTIIGANEYAVRFLGFDLDVGEEFINDSTEVAVGARVRMTRLSDGDVRELKPVYMIQKNRQEQFVQNSIPDWNISVAFTGMNVDDGSMELAFDGVKLTPEDWLIVQAYEKPMISLVWLGIILMSLGLIVTIYRRASDQKFSAGRAA